MDQNRNNPNHPQDGNPPEKNKPRNIWTALIITLALVLILSALSQKYLEPVSGWLTAGISKTFAGRKKE